MIRCLLSSKKVDPTYFLDADRLDFMCKYLYVKSKSEGSNHIHYRELYKKCIYQQTSAIEPVDRYIPNQTPKNNIEDYLKSFDYLIESFKSEGYNPKYPIHSNLVKTITGGAHRIACSLYYNQKIHTIISDDTTPKIRKLNREWFKENRFSEDIIKELEETLVKLSHNR